MLANPFLVALPVCFADLLGAGCETICFSIGSLSVTPQAAKQTATLRDLAKIRHTFVETSSKYVNVLLAAFLRGLADFGLSRGRKGFASMCLHG